MPKYAKFKRFADNKARLEEACMVIMNERCSSVLLNKLPLKEKDPRSFTIPCDIGQLHINNVLADLGASISLMPYTMYEKLSLGEPKATRMSLELADRLIQYPRGITKNVLIKVDKFVLPIDFVIIDMTKDSRVPIILGRPFLATARAMIDLFNKKITLRFLHHSSANSWKWDLYSSGSRNTLHWQWELILPVGTLSWQWECLVHFIPNTMNERCSAVLLNKLPSKEKDPRSFTIPCDIGQLHINNVLADLGASISLMPYTMYEKLSLGEPKATRMSLELADRVPIILGRPFLATARAMIDLFNKKTTLRVRDDEGLEKSTDQSDLESFESFECKAVDDSDSGEPIRILPNSDHTQRSRKPTFTCPYGTFAYLRMPFGLCNAPATFQRCMTAIFHDMMEDYMEVLMDDFLVFENSFDCCLANLDRMLVRCEETNFMLNWENCHFMVKEEIVLGHKIFRAGIEVDIAQIDVIAKLPYPTNVKGLLMKDVKFDFFNNYKKAFNILKEKLTTAPIIISPDWNVPFELMCDASDFAVGVVLEKRIDAKFKLIYYASKTLNNAQEHYTTTEKELLAVVFSFDMFRSYLILSKTVVYIDHSALKYLFIKQDAKPRLIRKGITDKFLDEHLMILKTKLNEDEPWYANYDEPYAFKLCRDNVMRRCVAGNKILEILVHCHSGPTRVIIVHQLLEGKSMNHDSFGLASLKMLHVRELETYHQEVKCLRTIFRSVRYNLENRSEKLDDALWAFRTAYKTPTGCTHFRLVNVKACHLPVEIEHKAYWVLKQCNMDLTVLAKNRFMKLNELMERWSVRKHPDLQGKN
nr:hypothetical protein [Tanacetum cinerariifolium]